MAISYSKLFVGISLPALCMGLASLIFCSSAFAQDDFGIQSTTPLRPTMQKELRVYDQSSTSSATGYIGIRAGAGTLSYTLTLPTLRPTANQVLAANAVSGGNVTLTWATPFSGTGTTNFLAKFASAGTLTNSLLFDNGTNIGVGTATPSSTTRFEIRGTGTTSTTTALEVDNSNGNPLLVVRNDGAITIGTSATTPDTRVEIFGNSVIRAPTDAPISFNLRSGRLPTVSANANHAIIGVFDSNNNSIGGISFTGGGAANKSRLNFFTAGGSDVSNINNANMVLDQNGNVGIGPTTPTFSRGAGLHILGNTADEGGSTIRLTDGGQSANGNFEIRSTRTGAQNRLEIGEGSDAFMTLLSDINRGSVGIGTTGPENLLEVSTSNNNIFKVIAKGVGWGGTSLAEIYSERTSTGTSPLLKVSSAFAPNAFYVQTSGNVGVGTLTPISTLEVRGAFGNPPTSGTTTNAIFSITSSNAFPSLFFGLHSSESGVFYSPWIQAADRNAPGTVRNLFLNPNGGNVGIGTGTITPTARLEVSGGDVRITKSSTANDLSGNTIHFVELYNSASTAMAPIVFTRRARGTANSPLTVQNTDQLGGISMSGHNGAAFVNGSRAAVLAYATETWTTTNNGTELQFWTTQNSGNIVTRRMTIANDGRVAIGSGSPTSARLEVYAYPANDNLVNSDIFDVKNSSGSSFFKVNYTGGVFIPTLGQGTVSINSLGQLTVSGQSDARLKTNIEVIPNALQKVMGLRGVTYNWKDGRDTTRVLGMIAQEMLKVAPELVFQTNNGYYGIHYAETTGLLVEAIKEQQKIIDQLKTEQAATGALIRQLQLDLQAIRKLNSAPKE